MERRPSPPNCSKYYWKLLPLLLSISWPSLVTSWVLVQKIYSKMYIVPCTNTHCDVTDSVNHGMVENTKTWISSERNMIFLKNKKNLNLCHRWNILRSYCFVAEVTFKTQTGFAYHFLETLIQSIQRCLNLYFNVSLSDVPSFFKNISIPRLEPTNSKQCCLLPLPFKISLKANIY